MPAAELDRLYDNPDCYMEYGDWSELAGEATDGTSDLYWCTDGGEEFPCLDRVDEDPDPATLDGASPAPPPVPPDASAGSGGSGVVGDACLPEQVPEGGFSAGEVYVETSSPDCAGVCLVDGFDGDPRGAEPDLVIRTIHCSCRCDGSQEFAEEFCGCPEGYECAPILEQGGPGVRGSYCVRQGS